MWNGFWQKGQLQSRTLRLVKVMSGGDTTQIPEVMNSKERTVKRCPLFFTVQNT